MLGIHTRGFVACRTLTTACLQQSKAPFPVPVGNGNSQVIHKPLVLNDVLLVGLETGTIILMVLTDMHICVLHLD